MKDPARIEARDVMRTDVTQLSPDDTIENALALFEEARIGGAPVVVEGRLVGVLTLSDVSRTEHLRGDRMETRREIELSEPVGEELTDELDPDEVFFAKEDYSAELLGRERVSDWMTSEVVSVEPGTTLQEVCRRMVEGQMHRVFVTEEKKLVGLISSFDVVRFVARGCCTELRRPGARKAERLGHARR